MYTHNHYNMAMELFHSGCRAAFDILNNRRVVNVLGFYWGARVGIEKSKHENMHAYGKYFLKLAILGFGGSLISHLLCSFVPSDFHYIISLFSLLGAVY